MSFEVDLVDTLLSAKLVKKQGRSLVITQDGLEHLKQKTGLDTPASCNDKAATNKSKLYNFDESPLARLASRKTKAGNTYLSANEFNAGERLRADFERASLQPRISANLSATAGLSGKGGFHQAHEISDFALDARDRVNKAVNELGPELSGVALDVCCFLKGLETVERERKWPPRSAKLMLKTALSNLSRHYGITSSDQIKEGGVRSWGSDGFRPNMP
ncbi:MAG: DUF6456 domain-containing protein [Rhizobiaceae bacterium]|nr:DUF6456 domain-containing protein [Rhizobiaceae bacterium]